MIILFCDLYRRIIRSIYRFIGEITISNFNKLFINFLFNLLSLIILGGELLSNKKSKLDNLVKLINIVGVLKVLGVSKLFKIY